MERKTTERNDRKERHKIKLNGMNRTKFNKQQQKETTKLNSNEMNEFQKLKTWWNECKDSIKGINL